MKNYLVNNNGSQLRFITRPFQESLTNDERSFAIEQNEIIKNYIKNTFKIHPRLVSRDKMGNIIIVTKVNETGASHCTFKFGILGINADKNSIGISNVGYVNFIEYDPFFDPFEGSYEKGMFITKLAVQQKYQQSGIGSLMLYALENYASSRGCTYIKLNSLRSFDIRNDITFPSSRILKAVRQIKRDDALNEKMYSSLNTPELRKFLRKNMFNRNLFFYNTNGYRIEEDSLGPDNQDPMEKTNLDIMPLDIGVKKRPTPYSITDEAYSLPEESDPIITLNISSRENWFSQPFIDTKNFVPLYVDPSKSGTNQLRKILSTVPPADELGN